MRLAAPPHVSTPKTCVAQSSVFLHLFGISVFFSLYLSPSLHPSLHVSLYLNFLFSMCMCLSVVWGCVFDSHNKRATVQVQGNSWYQRVEPLSLSVSLSLSLSLSVYFSLFAVNVSVL
jgi:hypothetical protein